MLLLQSEENFTASLLALTAVPGGMILAGNLIFMLEVEMKKASWAPFERQ